LVIYNVQGQKVKILIDGFKNSGTHNVIWDATDNNRNPVSSGIYLYQIITPEFQEQKSMLLLR